MIVIIHLKTFQHIHVILVKTFLGTKLMHAIVLEVFTKQTCVYLAGNGDLYPVSAPSLLHDAFSRGDVGEREGIFTPTTNRVSKLIILVPKFTSLLTFSKNS